MAKLKKCAGCGAEISKKAKACPHCGNPSAKRTSLITWFVLFLFLAIVYNMGTEDTKRVSSHQDQVIDVEKPKQIISSKTYFSTVEILNVRLEPNKKGSITSSIYENQQVNVYEIKQGWGRVSEYYNGDVEGKTGMVARWVFMKHLSKNPPIEKESDKTKISILEKALKSSDNYLRYKKSFIKASENLIKEKTCTVNDFKEMGGWMRSPDYSPKPIFFTYCGGMIKENRIYLNVKTGEIFK
jgi:hypothetical protein